MNPVFESPGLAPGRSALTHGRDESSTGVFRADELSMPRVRMYQDNVLVLMDWIRDMRRERKTEGLLVLPGTEKPGKGEEVWASVLAAGPGYHEGKRFIPCEVKPGDRVLVDSADAGDAVLLDGLEHRIVRQHNLLCVSEE